MWLMWPKKKKYENWSLTTGFSNVDLTGDLAESSFCDLAKVWLEWVKEMGQEIGGIENI